MLLTFLHLVDIVLPLKTRKINVYLGFYIGMAYRLNCRSSNEKSLFLGNIMVFGEFSFELNQSDVIFSGIFEKGVM